MISELALGLFSGSRNGSRAILGSRNRLSGYFVCCILAEGASNLSWGASTCIVVVSFGDFTEGFRLRPGFCRVNGVLFRGAVLLAGGGASIYRRVFLAAICAVLSGA